MSCSSGSTGTYHGGTGSSGSGGSGSGSGSGSADATQACVDAINQYRASIGRPPYTRWTSAESCVDGQAQADSASGNPHSAFQQCGEFAQDECPGWPGPPGTMITQCLAQMWAEGPGGGHYDNMSSTQYTQVSCGFYVLSDGSVWATQDFK